MCKKGFIYVMVCLLCIGTLSTFQVSANTMSVNDNTKGTENAQFEYSSGWHYGSQSGAYQNDNHWSNQVDAYCNIRFNGTGIALYGALDPGHGIAAISIDGGTEILVDQYSSVRQENSQLYSTDTLSSGDHILKVRVTGNKNMNALNTWIALDRVVITQKVNDVADARGRIRIPQSQLTVSATSQVNNSEVSNAFDNDKSTIWQASDSVPQSITIDLGDTYTVGKMDYAPQTTTKSGRMRNFNLYTSVDGTTYTKILDNVSYDFSDWWARDNLGLLDTKIYIYFDPVEASHIKLEILSTKDGANPCASEINVYRYQEEPSTVIPPVQPVSDPMENDELSNASRVLISRGLQIHSWIPHGGSGREYFNQEQYEGMNMTGVTYYDPPLYNAKFHEVNPNAQWNLAKAPNGGNTVGVNPPPEGFFFSEEQEANSDRVVSICFGDEGGYSKQEETYIKNWFERSRELYPNILVHTNQWQGQWNSSQLDSYVANCKPDLLTFDNYYWDQAGNTKDYDSVKTVLDGINWLRPRALKGIDGTGTKPIAFGQYLGCFKNGESSYGSGWYESTESQKYLVTNLTWASGGKWLDMFRAEYDPLYQILFGEDGWPTHHYDEFAEVFRQSSNLGPHLVRLNNIDIDVKSGKHQSGSDIEDNSTPTGWMLGAFEAKSEFHMVNVSAENLGNENNGLPGDVVIGYFEPLPGLSTDEFFTSTQPKYFMVVNGLVSGNGLKPDQQHGSLDETQQKITLTMDSDSNLKKVNRNTGEVEDVPLTQAGDAYVLEIILGGGEAELFYWEE